MHARDYKWLYVTVITMWHAEEKEIRENIIGVPENVGEIKRK